LRKKGKAASAKSEKGKIRIILHFGEKTEKVGGPWFRHYTREVTTCAAKTKKSVGQ